VSSPESTCLGGGAGSRSQHVWSQPRLGDDKGGLPQVCLVSMHPRKVLRSLKLKAVAAAQDKGVKVGSRE
jgi:hypothetical protein